jgi:hypothetical protein
LDLINQGYVAFDHAGMFGQMGIIGEGAKLSMVAPIDAIFQTDQDDLPLYEVIGPILHTSMRIIPNFSSLALKSLSANRDDYNQVLP